MDENLFCAVGSAGGGGGTYVARELLEGAVRVVVLGLGELTGRLELVHCDGLHGVDVGDARVDVDRRVGGLDGVMCWLKIHVHVLCL
jgi:hypothetical protein